jgi:transglutaminase-like putative cysteine protease
LAFYLFTSLVLLGRLHYLEKQIEWKKKRVFLSSESEGELSRSVLATAAILVFAAWVLPGALRSIEPAAQTWKNFTEPIVERLSDAVSALDSPYGTVAGENFYGSLLNLGSNAPVSDAPVFHVKVGEAEVERSRYYWRGRTYDVYENGSWTNTNSVHQSFDPGQDEIELIEPFKRIETQFQFTYYFPSQRLIYAPSELIWMDRRGQLSLDPHPGGRQDIHAWFNETSLTAGEEYQVRAQFANPTILDLQDAGSDYPAWITEKYLQVPQDLAPQLRELTEQITAPFGTPYGKTQAFTSYLRKEITYEDNLTEGPPPDADPLMWVLFDYKKGFCMYYATAEVLMLRTIGIPARMAVGFAQGEYDPETDQFIVARRNSHAWPEVYFPGIGWVEFEPTANQDPLRRQRGNIEAVSASGEGLDGTGDSPVPGEETPGGAQDQVDLLDEELELLLDMESRALGGDAPAETMLTNPWWGLSVAGLFLMLVIAGLILERRYSLSTQLPVYLVRRYEQGADKPPPWLARWAKWSALSPVERYFYVINHSLRTLGEKPAFHSTPAERTSALKELLPAAREAIEVLEGEHERALFTSHKADLSRARRAALKILLAAWHARLTNRGII